MSEEKIYCGSGKAKKTQYGGLLEANIDLDTLIEQFGNHGSQGNNGKRYIKLTIMKRKSPDDYGNTHYVIVNQWHPDTWVRPSPISVANGEVPEEPKPNSAYGPSDEAKKGEVEDWLF